ncbi:MAG: response regulator transcription factor [Clostridiales bacterium]|jgi:DNA-binding response OmpR family regulator|nr:response regulator transcription factor [Clostridiales bacterium]
MSKIKILAVDDDVNICELLRLYLTKEGYEVITAHNGVKAIELFAAHAPSVVILDIMLPGTDGWQVCRNIRNMSEVPVIMLTAKGETYDKVTGLELGADDYIVKPFEMKELIARIKAVLRRYGGAGGEIRSVVEYDGLMADIVNHQLVVGGRNVEIPPKELELLYFLASNPNKAFSRDRLLNEVWGFEFYGDTRTVDVHVKRIREKIEGAGRSWELKTVWGIGYKFEVS